MRSTYKIVFLGNSNVGKTTLMSQYLYQKVETSYGPTIGLDFVSTTLNVSGHKARLQLWDTAGQERFNSIIPNYTRNTFLTIMVFDLSSPETFEKIDHWINNSVKINDPENNIKILIVGNKKDLVDESTLTEYKEKGLEKAKKYNGTYVETSAMKYEGITDLIKVISDLVEKDIETNEEEEESIIKAATSIRKEKNGCC